jgi:molybdenum transport protein
LALIGASGVHFDAYAPVYKAKEFCMHFFTKEAWLESLLTDDCPGLDLTVELLGIAGSKGVMRFSPKENCIISGVEEAELLLRKCGLAVWRTAANGDPLEAGQTALEARGSAAALHKSWKICQIVMEYMTGIAGRAAHMVSQAHAVNPNTRVAVTRKNFPGAKALCLEAAMNGGATIHRQNLSDSILIFEQHRVFLPGGIKPSMRTLASMMNTLHTLSPERKISAEVDTFEDALLLAEAGVDIIQCEKFSCEALAETVGALRATRDDLAILAAGGINGENAAQFASTGVDVLVTTWPFFGKPSDIKVVMEVDDHLQL